MLVYQAGGSLPVWVFVGDDGASFAWDSGRRRHPVTDVIGAAQALAAYLGNDTDQAVVTREQPQRLGLRQALTGHGHEPST